MPRDACVSTPAARVYRTMGTSVKVSRHADCMPTGAECQSLSQHSALSSTATQGMTAEDMSGCDQLHLAAGSALHLLGMH